MFTKVGWSGAAWLAHLNECKWYLRERHFTPIWVNGGVAERRRSSLVAGPSSFPLLPPWSRGWGPKEGEFGQRNPSSVPLLPTSLSHRPFSTIRFQPLATSIWWIAFDWLPFWESNSITSAREQCALDVRSKFFIYHFTRRSYLLIRFMLNHDNRQPRDNAAYAFL